MKKKAIKEVLTKNKVKVVGLVLGATMLCSAGAVGYNAYADANNKQVQAQQDTKVQEQEQKTKQEKQEQEQKIKQEQEQKAKQEVEQKAKDEQAKKTKEEVVKKQQEEKKVKEQKEQKEENTTHKEVRKEKTPVKKETASIKKVSVPKKKVVKRVNIDGIVTEGNVPYSLAVYAKSKMSGLPSNVRRVYENSGYKIKITSKDIASTYFPEWRGNHIIGLYSNEAKTLYLSNSQYAIDSAMYHELGHFIDGYRGFISDSSEFRSIFNKERNTFKVYSKDGHYKTNPQEFFAEVFQETINNPQRCKSSAPKSYAFVKKVVASM